MKPDPPLHSGQPPERVVSLVPSLTETVFALGEGKRLVGITRYCIYPSKGVRGIEKVGGVRDPDRNRILSLQPKLVIADWEENRKEDIEALQKSGIPVAICRCESVSQVPQMIRDLGKSLAAAQKASRVAKVLERVIRRVKEEVSFSPPLRTLCLLWKEPFMAPGGETYLSDLMRHCGAEHVFQSDDKKYREVSLPEISRADPEVILLPSEPYPFSEKDAGELMEALPGCSAVLHKRIYCLPGEMICWHGVRTRRGLHFLSRLLWEKKTKGE